MKKVIRLTENDLTRIVKRVIMEQAVTDKTGTHLQYGVSDMIKDRQNWLQQQRDARKQKELQQKEKNELEKQKKSEEEKQRIARDQIKIGDDINRIYKIYGVNTGMSGGNFRTPKEFYVIKPNWGFSIGGQPKKLVSGNEEFSRALDGDSSISSPDNAKRILDRMVDKKQASKKGEKYFFNSKVDNRPVVFEKIHIYYPEGRYGNKGKIIKVDENNRIVDEEFVNLINSRIA